jgi:glycosyltransferase involved in cell wall biosynthesis
MNLDNVQKQIDCSIVASVFNEEEGILMFYKSLSKTLVSLQMSCEIIFVNDGSTDNSLEIFKEIATLDATVRVVNF